MGINERRVAVASIAKLIPSNPQGPCNPLYGEEGMDCALHEIQNKGT